MGHYFATRSAGMEMPKIPASLTLFEDAHFLIAERCHVLAWGAAFFSLMKPFKRES
jgi:hypothetical protein